MGAALLASLLGLSIVRAFIERHAVRVECGELMPPFRFVQWGWIEEWRDYDVVPFFVVKLPSWSVEMCVARREWCLMQRGVVWTRKRGWYPTFFIPPKDPNETSTTDR